MRRMELTQTPRRATPWLVLFFEVMMGIGALAAIYVGLTR
jgi:hypothetical protein